MKALYKIAIFFTAFALTDCTEKQEEYQADVTDADSSTQGSVVNGEIDSTPLVLPKSGATVTNSEIISGSELEYYCRVTITSDTAKAIKGVELIDFSGIGNAPSATAFNMRLAVKPLCKLKIKLPTHGSTTTKFRVNSSMVNPQVAKVFYSDGSIQHSNYDFTD